LELFHGSGAVLQFSVILLLVVVVVVGALRSRNAGASMGWHVPVEMPNRFIRAVVRR
jgi:hypothetical protein